MPRERRGAIEGALFLGLGEVGPLDELGGEDDSRSTRRGVANQGFDAREVVLELRAECALDDAD